jgi:DNA polymerase-3 subunit epsilon
MMRWFKTKDYPQFWKEYQQAFQNKTSQSLDEVRFVVFDTETTGLDTKQDKILSIGAVAVKGNSIDISDSFEIYLEQDKFNGDTVEIHGILKSGNLKKHTESVALQQFLDYTKNAILVAHHAAFDVAMINQGLKNMGLPKLKNKVLDTGFLFRKTTLAESIKTHHSLDILCDVFKVSKHDRHTASGDAYITAIIMIKIIALLKKNRQLALSDLFINPNKLGLL